MNKKLLIITTIVLAATGTALAFNDNASNTLQGLTGLTSDEIAAGEFRPEDGWGIFGNRSEDGTGYMSGKSGQDRRGLKLEDCDEENPLNYGSQGRGRGVKN